MSGVSNLFETPNNFKMLRGSRYNAYAALREAKLRSKTIKNAPPLPPKDNKSLLVSTPPEKVSKGFVRKRKGSSILAQSVPDFSSALRKENRKPSSLLSPIVEKSATPPAKGSSRLYEINTRLMGSKSSVSSEKRGGGSNGMLTARKSYANMDELKKFSVSAANAINGENRGGIGRFGGRVGGRSTVLGSRQFY